jgi:hypothetical protein
MGDNTSTIKIEHISLLSCFFSVARSPSIDGVPTSWESLEYLDSLEKSLFKITFPPIEISAFCKEVEKYIQDTEKELGTVEPKFWRQNLWKVRKLENKKLLIEIRNTKESITRDDSRLVDFCSRIGFQPNGEKRMKDLLEKVYRGEIGVNRTSSSSQIGKDMEKEIHSLKQEIQNLRQKNQELQDELSKSDEKISKARQETRDLSMQFGSIITNSLRNKELEMKEGIEEKIKQARYEMEKEKSEELVARENSIRNLMENLSDMKLKVIFF